MSAGWAALLVGASCRLVAELELERRVAPDEDVAIVASPPEGQDLLRCVEAVQRRAFLAPGGAVEALILAGAEWRLVAEAAQVRLELIDRGLFASDEAIAYAVDLRAPTGLQPMAELPGRVLAIAATAGGLFVLAERRLIALGLDGRVMGELDLDLLPPADMPARDPLGAIVPLGPRSVALGSSWYAAGGLVSLEGDRLVFVRSLPGLPVLARGRELWLARIDGGRGRYATRILVYADGAIVGERQLRAPATQVLAVEPGPLVVDERGHLWPETGARLSPRTGTGASAWSRPGGAIVLALSSPNAGSDDELRVLGEGAASPPVVVPGAVSATAPGERGGRAGLFVAAGRGPKTTIAFLPFDERGPP